MKKALSFILALTLIISLVPMGALAADAETTEPYSLTIDFAGTGNSKSFTGATDNGEVNETRADNDDGTYTITTVTTYADHRTTEKTDYNADDTIKSGPTLTTQYRTG